jgi:hypothetical protein
VRLRTVDGVVNPASALLHANLAPLIFFEEPVFRDELGDFSGQNHVARSKEGKTVTQWSSCGERLEARHEQWTVYVRKRVKRG